MNDRAGRPVLVGYDGSPQSQPALRWAVSEARLRSRSLVVCHVWRWPYPLRPRNETAERAVLEAAAEVADDGVRRARALDGGLDVRPLLVRGAAAAGLLGAAREAVLVIVGSHGHHGPGGLSICSTAVQVSAHATRPVVVVPSSLPEAGRSVGGIVVGMDGSPASRAALSFAFEEAVWREEHLTAICGWWDGGLQPAPFTDADLMERGARARFEEFLAGWRSGYPAVPLRAEFVLGSPGQAIIDAAKGALLLVLGDRGIASTPRMLLGPVTRAALDRARTPIAVVRAFDG